MSTMTAFEGWIDRRWNGPVEPLSRDWLVSVMGLGGEVGEVTEPCKKHYRDGKHPGDELKLELGDVLHYLTVIAHSYGWTLEELIEANMDKLTKRDATRGRVVP